MRSIPEAGAPDLLSLRAGTTSPLAARRPGCIGYVAGAVMFTGEVAVDRSREGEGAWKRDRGAASRGGRRCESRDRGPCSWWARLSSAPSPATLSTASRRPSASCARASAWRSPAAGPRDARTSASCASSSGCAFRWTTSPVPAWVRWSAASTPPGCRSRRSSGWCSASTGDRSSPTGSRATISRSAASATTRATSSTSRWGSAAGACSSPAACATDRTCSSSCAT